MKKSCRKCAPKASLRPLFNVDKYPNSHYMKGIVLKRSYFERELSKSLKKVNLSFERSPV